MTQSTLPDCTPDCDSFRCDRDPPAMKTTQKGGSKAVWCTWVNDECDGPWCKFGVCAENKMTSNGKCERVRKEATKAEPGHYEQPMDPESVLDEKSYKMFKKTRGTGNT
jgi:hypothetical protein